MMKSDDRVVIVGAGPVGLVAAVALGRQGIPSVVLEAEPELVIELRGSTFHPPTLDLLDAFGIVDLLIAQGLKAPTWQFRDRETGPVATFDLGLLAGDTAHPYRVQCEQWRLTRLLAEEYRKIPGADIRFAHRVMQAQTDEAGVTVTAETPEGPVTVKGRHLIAADGARSAIRRSLNMQFEGFTYPEYFLIASTDFLFEAVMKDIAYVNYIADPQEWLVLLRVRDLWRVLVPAPPTSDPEAMLADDSLEQMLQRVVPRADTTYTIAHRAIYHVHQRVATHFRQGTEKLAAVWAGADERLLDRYERQRHTVAVEAVQQHTDRNHRLLSERDPEVRRRALDEFRRIATDPVEARAYMLKSSMITGLRRAAEIE